MRGAVSVIGDAWFWGLGIDGGVLTLVLGRHDGRFVAGQNSEMSQSWRLTSGRDASDSRSVSALIQTAGRLRASKRGTGLQWGEVLAGAGLGGAANLL